MLMNARFAGVVGAVVLLVPLCAVGQVEQETADPLSLVPVDAWATIVIRDIHKTSGQIDQYLTELGQSPGNLESEWIRKAGLGKAIETNRPTLFVVMNKQLYKEDPFAVLLPIKDFLIASRILEGTATDVPGIMKGESEEFGACYFAKNSDYLIISPTQAVVNAIFTSKRGLGQALEPHSKDLLKASDLYVRVNLQSLVNVVKPYLMMFGAMGMMQGMGPMPGMGGPGGGAGQTPPTPATPGEPATPDMATQMQAMQYLAQVINALTQLLDQLGSLDVALGLGEKNVKVTTVCNFTPGGDLSAVMAAQKPGTDPLLKGLPQSQFTLAAGLRWEPKLTKFQKALLELTPQFTDPQDAQAYKEAAKGMAEMVKKTAVVMSLQPPQPGRGLMNVQYMLETTDAKKYLDLMRTTIELLNKVAIPTQSGRAGQMKTKYEKAAAQIAGVSVDRCSYDILSVLPTGQLPGMADQKEQITGVLAMLFGSPDGKVQLNLAAVNDKTVIIELGGDESSLEKLIATAKSGEAPLNASPKVAEAGKLLPKQKIFEGYIDVGTIVNLALGLQATMMAATTPPSPGAPPQTAPTTPPTISTPLIAAAGTVVDSGIRGELVIPIEVIKQLQPLAGMMPKGPGKQGIFKGLRDIVPLGGSQP